VSAPPAPEVRSDLSARGKLRLAALILEGYFYIVLILATFGGTLGLLVWGFVARRPILSLIGICFALPVLASTAAAVRSLWFSVPLPKGIAIDEDGARQLHQMIDEVRREIRAPRVDRVLIADAANATAIQVPRLGLLGTRNILVLGYPLLALLPERHVRAVIAHELGHFSHSHSSFSRWVFRTRVSWLRLMQTLRSRGTSPLFVEWLFRNYVPRLDATSTAIARQHEFIADKCAASAVGSRTTAEAIVSLELTAMYIDETFWPAIHGRMKHATELPRPFSELRSRFTADHAALSSERLEMALSGGADDTHPTVRERLAALGEEARGFHPDAVSGSFNETFLNVVASKLDDAWCREQAPEWLAWRSDQSRARARLEALEASGRLSGAQMFERARLVEELEGSAVALPLYLAAANTGQAEASLEAGRLLIEVDPDHAVRLLEHALSSDDALALEACWILINFFESRSSFVDAEKYRARARQIATRSQMSAEERETLSPLDQLSNHDLLEQEVRAIGESLSQHPNIEKAYLVRKTFRYSTGSELVLCVVCRKKTGPETLLQVELAEVVAATLRVMVVNRQYEVQTTLDALPGARIFDRKSQDQSNIFATRNPR